MGTAYQDVCPCYATEGEDRERRLGSGFSADVKVALRQA